MTITVSPSYPEGMEESAGLGPIAGGITSSAMSHHQPSAKASYATGSEPTGGSLYCWSRTAAPRL